MRWLAAIALVACSSSSAQATNDIVVAKVTRCGDPQGPAALGELDATSDPTRADFLARHPIAQVRQKGGSVLDAPRVVSVYAPNDPMQADTEDLLDSYGCTPAWRDAVGEYGVGDLVHARTVVLPESPPLDGATQFTDWIRTSVTAGAFGDLGAEDVLLFFLPPGETVDPNECLYENGAHDELVLDDGRHLTYAWVLDCTPTTGTVERLLQRTIIATHELIESSTNPLPHSAPAWQSLGDGIRPSPMPGYAPSDEVADFCEGASAIAADYPFATARAYSNRRARAGRDPCSVTADAIPLAALVKDGKDVSSIDFRATTPTFTLDVQPGVPTGPYDIEFGIDIASALASAPPFYGVTSVEGGTSSIAFPSVGCDGNVVPVSWVMTMQLCPSGAGGLGCTTIHVPITALPRCLVYQFVRR